MSKPTDPDARPAQPTGSVRSIVRVWPALALLVGLVAPLIFSTWYTFNNQRAALESAFELELEQMTTVLANGMSEPIWNLTPELGRPLVDSLLGDERVVAVRVTSKVQGEFLLAERTPAPDIAPREFTKTVVRRGVDIGNVSIAVDESVVASQMATFWPEIYAVGGVQLLLALGIVVFAYRVLRRQERQQALSEMNERLRDEVQSRALELKQAHDELLRKESLAVLGRLTATVSHELRNPLGTISASLSTLAKVFRDGTASTPAARPTVTRVLDRAQRNIERCSRITDELLGFTRLGVASKETIELDRWLRELVSDFNVPGTVNLDVRLGSGAMVDVDQERLRRAVTNLLGNAVQAVTTSRGATRGGVVEVTSATAGDRVEVRVRDNGDGIAPELRERIFEPLFSTRAFGFGLGLPLVKQVCEHHGGGVEALEVSEGAEFVLWLPLSEASPETRTAVRESAG